MIRKRNKLGASPNNRLYGFKTHNKERKWFIYTKKDFEEFKLFWEQNKHLSYNELSIKFKIPYHTIYRWIQKFKNNLDIYKGKYSDEIKNKIYQDRKTYKLREIAEKYNMPISTIYFIIMKKNGEK